MDQLLLCNALQEYGVEETVGGQHNPRILRYFKEIGHDWVKDDETAWCSAFVNWICKISGFEYTGKLNARSWLDIGEEVSDICDADVVIFWRSSPNSWKGHVGFPINYDEDGKHINCLGGNQSNMVNIAGYDKGRLLGFRKLSMK